MIRQTNTKELVLEDLTQGNRYALVITGADSAVELQFKHAGDATWRVMPDFDGTLTDVIRGDFFCFTPTMKLVFADAPAEGVTYYVSCIPFTASQF